VILHNSYFLCSSFSNYLWFVCIVGSFYFAEGCAAPSIYFIIGPTNRCTNFITGFGVTTCTGDHSSQ